MVLSWATANSDVVSSLLSGRCDDSGNPCVQLCFNIRDDMYECACRQGHNLMSDGYNCLKGNQIRIENTITFDVEPREARTY